MNIRVQKLTRNSYINSICNISSVLENRCDHVTFRSLRFKLGMPGVECLTQGRDAIINICQYSKSKEIDGFARPFDEWREENMRKCPVSLLGYCVRF